jgi:predicted RNase H-like HicB family nuclease
VTNKEVSVDERDKSPRDYLRRPYARVLTPDDETGTYTAEILEFPGCIAQGETPDEAYERLESAAAGWVEAALDMGQEIPEPSDPYSYSGRIALRLPRSLHRRAAQMAERDGTSLNQFLVAAVAERVGAESLYTQMLRRLGELVTTPPTLHLHVHGFSTPAQASGFKVFEGQDATIRTSQPLAISGLPGRG